MAMRESQILYVGTQEGLDVYEGGADRWEKRGHYFSGPVDAIASSWEDAGTVYCGIIYEGLYRSCDTGKRWERVLRRDVRAVSVDPGDDSVVYAGTEPVHLYRSESRGDHWEELRGVLDLPEEVKKKWRSNHPPYYGHVRHIFIGKDRPDALYLCLEHGGIVRSLDRGGTWEDVSEGIDYLDIHMISKLPGRELYYVTSARGFFSSRDPSRGWTRIEKGIGGDYFHDLLVLQGDPSTMMIATANGSPGRWNRPGMAQAAIYRSADGASWQQVGEGLPKSLEKMVWSLAAAPSRPEHIYAGCGQVNRGQPASDRFPTGGGEIWFSSDRGDNWKRLELETPAVRVLWLSS